VIPQKGALMTRRYGDIHQRMKRVLEECKDAHRSEHALLWYYWMDENPCFPYLTLEEFDRLTPAATILRFRTTFKNSGKIIPKHAVGVDDEQLRLFG